MKPSLNKMMSDISQKLLEEVLPAFDSEYSQRSIGSMAMMLKSGIIEYEHGADIRAQENNEMRELFATATEMVEDAELKKRVETAAKTRDSSFRISALETMNDELKETLIELHAYVEEINKPWANELVERIWKHLDASAMRRKELFPSFI